jgi:ferredoxin
VMGIGQKSVIAQLPASIRGSRAKGRGSVGTYHQCDPATTKIIIVVRLPIIVIMSVKVEIDQEGCIQCGRCYNDECPEVYKEGEDGTSEIG